MYTGLWGPCDGMAGHLTQWYYDYSEVYGLKFARVQSDKISSLREYRDMAEPTFLFFLDGEEVARVNGPNVPAVLAAIKSNAPPFEP